MIPDNLMKVMVRGGSLLLLLVLGVTIVFAQSPGAVANTSAECAELPQLKAKLERSESRLRDWAELGRYRESNRKLTPAAKNEARVVFIGDSITDWWDDKERGNNFFPGKPYINRGIGGQTTPQMLVRFYQDVIALQPKAVVFLAGTNDLNRDPTPAMLEEIKSNLRLMSELARLHQIHVVLASLLPVHDQGHDREGKPVKRTDRRPPGMILQLNDWMKNYAGREGHTYLDYHSALLGEGGMLRTELSEDGLHVNPKGYQIMAPLAEAALARALEKR